MYAITKTFTFCYGHRLYRDPGKCGHLHGHTGRAEIALEGKALNELGMLKNFDDIKANIGRWIDENMDHRMLLNNADPLVKILQGAEEKLFLMEGNPTAENIARLIFDMVVKIGLPVKDVTFWESPTACATYSK